MKINSHVPSVSATKFFFVLSRQFLGTVAPLKLIFAVAINKLDFNQFLGRGVYLSKVPMSRRERITMTRIWTLGSEGARRTSRAEAS